MKPGAGKIKGSSFERLIAKRLSLWLSSGARHDLLWRSAMSGGRATIQLSQGIINKTQTGDLTAIDKLAYEFTERFLVELKHYKDLDLITGFIKNKGILYKFWYDLVEHAYIYKKSPLLICCQNNLPILIITTPSGSSFLGLQGKHKIFLPQWNGAGIYLFDSLTPKFW